LVGRVAFWEILPGRSGAQYPEDTVEDLAWISPGSSSSVFSSRWIWDEWLQYFPLLVCEVHAALVLLLEGHMTAPLYPHFRIYEIASTKVPTEKSNDSAIVANRWTDFPILHTFPKRSTEPKV
jgi:hypothetical protein